MDIEKIKASRKRWRLKNTEKIKKYRLENKEKFANYSCQFRKRNAEKLKKKRQEVRLKVLMHYSNGDIKCACCGEKELKFLSLDHINDDGYLFRRKNGSRCAGADSYYRLIKMNYPEGLQVLCHNCNCSKGYYGRCPHKDIQ